MANEEGTNLVYSYPSCSCLFSFFVACSLLIGQTGKHLDRVPAYFAIAPLFGNVALLAIQVKHIHVVRRCNDVVARIELRGLSTAIGADTLPVDCARDHLAR